MEKLDYQNRKVLVLGYGRSGRSAISALLALGANVTLTTNEVISDEGIRQQLKGWGVEIVDGHHPVSLLNDIELIVKNPGIPYTIDFLKEALARDVPIVTDVELAYHISPVPIIGITGTNGKTTVTHLIGEMLERSGFEPILCGNIGYPASQAAREAVPGNILVMELSSFQLMGVRDFRPDTAVFTNIYEAHLDYHGSKENYVKAKLNLLRNMGQEEKVVFNGRQRNMVEDMTWLSIEYFSTDGDAEAMIKDNMITYQKRPLIGVDEVLLEGEHNHENILAALLAAKNHGASDTAVIETLKHFGSIPHRMEYLGLNQGVGYYNDSKATNNLATSFALKSFRSPVIWIAGGLDRGQSLESLVPDLEHVRLIIAFGEMKEKFVSLADELGIDSIVAENPHDGVIRATAHAHPGDVVLFSPACASWDQYKDFEARGDHFKEGFTALDN